MNFRSVVLSLTVICLLVACQKENNHKTYFEDGTLREVIAMTGDSLRNGPYIRYNNKGNVIEKANYLNDKLNGERLLYFSDTEQVEIEEHYVDDAFHGVYKTYYPSGKLELEFMYENNVLTGISKKYYENGNIQEVINFVGNEENGTFTEYHDNGKPEWKGTYMNGENEVGLLENFDENGVLIKKMKCTPSLIDSSSVCRTIWTLEKGDIELEKLFDTSE